MYPKMEDVLPVPGMSKDELKKRVHKAAQDGMALSVFALLCNAKKPIVDEILDHITEDNGQKTTPLVIAAMLGKSQVVEVLIKDFGVNIEQKSTVRFDGYVIQDATALWCAAGAGHLNVVEVLVKNGADVNNSTASNSTPLRAACFDGRLDIVKYLLEHGADLTIPNKYDNTCLMISSYKGHTKVVRFLLENGANPDIKAHCGATSIHFAADCGHLGVVEELVHFEASMLSNGDGMTPIIVAAECGKEEIVSFLLKHIQCTPVESIHAIQLLGASFANDKELYNLNKTFAYLKKAMVMKTNLLQSQETEMPLCLTPIKAYGNHRECQNIEELNTIRHDQNAMHMEALTIRERILGSQNPELPHPIIFRGAVFADNGQFDRCISLWMHALVLRQTNSRSIAKDLLRLAQVFSQMVTIKAELSFDQVELVLQHGLKELESHHKAISSVKESVCDASTNATELYHNNILSFIYLIVIALHTTMSDSETLRLRKVVYLFLKSKPHFKNGYSPLHVVVDPSISVDDFHVNNLVSFPSQSLVSLFIICGANIDAVDCSGNTPLHVIVQCQMPNITFEKERMEIVLYLLRTGAHCDIANSQRQTPFNLARGTTLSLLHSRSEMSLRCLAARCIRENNIPFESSIPNCLKTFVTWH